MLTLFIAFVVSLVVTLGLIRLASRHLHLAGDVGLSGPQKFHVGAVPRVGGVGVAVGMGVALVAVSLWLGVPGQLRAALVVLACAAPALLAGLVEDLTKNQSPRRRLFFTAVSAGLGVLLAGAVITRTDIPGLDWVVQFSILAGLLTVFVVTGVANAVNIIDGFNGLASMCAMLMLGAIAVVARDVGDWFVMRLALAGLGGVLGFFLWNFPAGLIFLGDGGAYLLGFWVAETGILLIARNPQVSPLFPLVVCLYPVVETLFSMYRRRWLRSAPMGLPDGVHLHSLVFRRLVRWGRGSVSPRIRTRRNSLTSPYLWALCMTTIAPALLWWRSSARLGLYVFVFALAYLVLYWRIVRFRAPRWLVLRPRSPGVRRPPVGD